MDIQLSVVIITFNEERNIERCLQSVLPVADEVIVLDSYSTDKTKEICENYNVRFEQHAFDGHIQQKNRAIQYTSNEYVLSLDADEALSECLSQSILKLKKGWGDKEGYYMNRLTNYCGKWIRHCGWYPDSKLRLFRKKDGQWTGTNPHDRFEVSDNQNTEKLKGDLLHYSYYTIKQHLDQVNYFSDILAKEQYNTKSASILKIIVSPIFKFFRDYWIKLGFLDGYYGFIVCSISSFATLIKYAKIRQLQRLK